MKRLATKFYTRSNRLYLPTTMKRVDGVRQLFEARGGAFTSETQRRFRAGEDEPDAETLFETVDDAYDNDREKVEGTRVGMGEQDQGVVFGGYLGEPLLKLEEVCGAARLIKETRHGVPLILSTTGVVGREENNEMLTKIPELLGSGVKTVHLFIPAASPKKYDRLHDALAFAVNCGDSSIKVKCLTVAGTGEESEIEKLARAVGCLDFEVKKRVS